MRVIYRKFNRYVMMAVLTRPRLLLSLPGMQDGSLQRLNWYRTPIERGLLAELNQRSDAKGLAQTLGHLGLLALSGTGAWIAASQQQWLLMALILFVHGTVFAFLLNGFHELCHGTVFKTRWLNTLFLNVFSFIGQYNPVFFWTSHQEHHKYTLHPPDDMEVVLPVTLTLESFLKVALINPWGLVERTKGLVRLSLGRIDGAWGNRLFPASDPARRAAVIRWARIHLFGHLALTIGSLAMGWWMLPVVITLAPYYGGWLLYLCNNAQHVGLQDNTEDYRLCVRTIILNPVVQFLYWHMNYHTEHHMYAAVPCYNLKRLHAAIKHDLPECPVGLVATWQQIIGILWRQRLDPGYEFAPQLPDRANAV
jgi:fatty acid desaturase